MSKTSYSTRFSYALPDIGGQLLFCWIMWYQAYFLTDVYGISAASVGTILFIARWVDAIDAPIWGIIFEKTNSRWGKSRPWFLWLSLPFAVFGVLTFLSPDLSHTAKVWYAAITYIACNVIYTGINTPVTSILSALTPDPHERVTLTTFRMFGSKLGVLIVNLTGLDLVHRLGNGDDRKGFLIVIPIFAIISLCLFLLAFRNLKETIPVSTKPQPILGTFGAIKGNWPWIIIFISGFLFWMGFISRVTVTPHFFKYVLHREDLIKTANTLDFASLATAFLLPWFCRKISKGTVWALGLFGMALGQIVVYLGVGYGNSIPLIMAGWTIGFLASGVAMAMPFAVLSDSVDYGEWKTGIRAAGLLTAVGAAFCLKAGAGLGGALPMWVLSGCGYAPNVEQTASSLRGIEFGIIWLPIICFVVGMIPVLFYKRFEVLEPQIQADLKLRRETQP